MRNWSATRVGTLRPLLLVWAFLRAAVRVWAFLRAAAVGAVFRLASWECLGAAAFHLVFFEVLLAPRCRAVPIVWLRFRADPLD